MKAKLVKRYYCDFCRKSGGSAGHMRRHESACTMNPNRVCRVCKMAHGDLGAGEGVQSPIAQLLALLPDPAPFRYKHQETNGTQYYEDELGDETNAALPELRDTTGNCPACIMAALRQKGIPVGMVSGFDFKKEIAEIWSDVNSERAGQE